jgi:hypothetical protein
VRVEKRKLGSSVELLHAQAQKNCNGARVCEFRCEDRKEDRTTHVARPRAGAHAPIEKAVG